MGAWLADLETRYSPICVVPNLDTVGQTYGFCSTAPVWRVDGGLVLRAILRFSLSSVRVVFTMYGPRTWNSLPADLRTPDTTLCSFKRHLKAHLFQQ